MNVIDRLSRTLVTVAARRWPAELADELAREWHAELAALRLDRGPWRSIAFAGSLALSPAVEAPGEDPVTWQDRLAGLGRALPVPAALTLLAAALFNAVHLVQDRFGPPAGLAALGVTALAMVLLGRRATVGRVVLLGATMYGFLLAGNQVAVMPFMGWIDIAPAVAAWTVLTALTVHLSSRLKAAGRSLLGGVAALVGSAIALDVAAAAGSLHAAASLGVSMLTAPSWFPLALLPGGTAAFGAYFPDGTAAFGSLQQVGPAFHASDLLLANASAMIGPLTLCSASVASGLIRHAVSAPANRTPSPTAARPGVHRLHRAHPLDRGLAAGGKMLRDPLRKLDPHMPRDPFRRVDPRIPLGAAAALGGLAVSEVLRRSGDAVEVTLHRLVDNSAVFGFGFLGHPAGRMAVALLAGLLVIHAGTPARTD